MFFCLKPNKIVPLNDVYNPVGEFINTNQPPNLIYMDMPIPRGNYETTLHCILNKFSDNMRNVSGKMSLRDFIYKVVITTIANETNISYEYIDKIQKLIFVLSNKQLLANNQIMNTFRDKYMGMGICYVDISQSFLFGFDISVDKKNIKSILNLFLSPKLNIDSIKGNLIQLYVLGDLETVCIEYAPEEWPLGDTLETVTTKLTTKKILDMIYICIQHTPIYDITGKEFTFS